MRILYIADARSPIARNWIERVVASGNDVAVVSSYPVDGPSLPGVTLHVVPIGFSGVRVGGLQPAGAASAHRNDQGARAVARRVISSGLRSGRSWVAPLEVRRHVGRLRAIVERVQPDLVHAMRIPFEGIFAARALPRDTPFLVSVWGNDFTLHARRNPLIARETRFTMARADAVHVDCRRDLLLATEWGFTLDRPHVVLPGAGGIQLNLFHPHTDGIERAAARRALEVPEDAPVIVNPRGFRDYVRNDVFFAAIAHVVRQRPDTRVLCVAMAGRSPALAWLEQYGLHEHVRLLPVLSRPQMAEVFRAADITVSASVHDGTPNTLLEAMASGCYPVAGDIASVREWITDGENGLLVDPTDQDALADAILRAIDLPDRLHVIEANRAIIAERAEYDQVMRDALEFYACCIGRAQAGTASASRPGDSSANDSL
jgi:glycosyltransferase involved in cell wall biosynthesis